MYNNNIAANIKYSIYFFADYLTLTCSSISPVTLQNVISDHLNKLKFLCDL